MKKYLGAICCALMISIIGIIGVKAGYFVGPDKSLYVTAVTKTFSIEGTIANDSAQHYKKIYAQSGSQGSWSDLVAPTVHSVSKKDTRAIWEDDTAFLNPCWKVNATDPLSCAS